MTLDDLQKNIEACHARGAVRSNKPTAMMRAADYTAASVAMERNFKQSGSLTDFHLMNLYATLEDLEMRVHKNQKALFKYERDHQKMFGRNKSPWS